MNEKQVSDRKLLGVGVILAFVAVLMIAIGGNPGLAETTPRPALPGTVTSAASLAVDADASTGRSLRVASQQQPARVRVVCDADGGPVAGASVRVRSSAGADAEHVDLVTAQDGSVEVPIRRWLEAPIEVSARGYETARASLSSAVTEHRVALRGLGAIEFALADGAQFPPEAVLSVQAMGRQNAPVHAASPGARSGTMSVEWLRPDAFHQLSIRGCSGTLVPQASEVVAGWPTPTRVTIVARPALVHEVRLAGIREEDCPRLTVGLASAGREGAGSSVRWDAAGNLGVATPIHVGPLTPTEVVVRGPLGLLVGKWALESRTHLSVTLHLEHSALELDGDASQRSPDDLLYWSCDGRSGTENPGPDDTLRLLTSSETVTTIADLKWGRLVAEQVEVPRHEPILFTQPPRGEVRITDVRHRVVTLLGVPSHEAQQLSVVGDQLWATVDVGSYRVQVDDRPLGATVTVKQGEVRHISIDDIAQRATLRVVLPKGAEGASTSSVLLRVAQPGSGNRVLRQLSIDSTATEQSFSDLPPGEVLTEAKSTRLGVAAARCVLHPGAEFTLELPSWAPPRPVRLQLVDGDDLPMFREEYQVAVIGQSQSATIYGTTDERGESLVTLSGGGSVMVGTKRGFSVHELAADATSLRVTFGTAADGHMRVQLSGWWIDKVRSMGSLRVDNGTVEFVPGRASGEHGAFRVPKGDPFVLVAMLRDRSKVFIAPTPGADLMTLDVPPASTHIRIAADDTEMQPHNVMVRLESVCGINVSGTSFARSLGQCFAFGDELRLMQAAKLTVVAEAAPGHGGLAWRSPAVEITPGLDRQTIRLEVLQ